MQEHTEPTGNAVPACPVAAGAVHGQLTPEDRIFSVKELAAIIGFHPMTVYKWIDSQGLPVRRSMRSGRISIVWREFNDWWKADRGL